VSKIKNISRAGWVVVGVVATVLLVPTMAVAATVAYNGIEGTNGTTTTQNKAEVTSAGQLLANEANPSSFVTVLNSANCSAGGIYKIPSGKALIITGANFYNSASSAGTDTELDLEAGPSSSPCGVLLAASTTIEQDSTDNQVFQPGIAVPAGDAIGMASFNNLGTAEFYGYLVPAGAVPSAQLRDARKFATSHSATTR